MSAVLVGRAGTVARGISLAAAAVFLFCYVAIVTLRITYPFELEWMEGGVLDHVRVAASGGKIFAKPNLEFVSFLYPPLYYYVAALSAAVFGMDFFALRLVSFVSSLGCLALIFAIVRRETNATLPAVLAAGLYVACFDRVGGWLDIARVDSLFMLLLLGGLYGIAFARTRAGLLGVGLLLGCAALVKQSAVVICLPLGLYALVWDRNRGAWWAASAFVFTACCWWLLDVIHEGWFRYYCFTIPSRHPLVPGQFTAFWSRDMLPIGFAAMASLFCVAARPSEPGRERRLFFAALAIGMIGASWSVTSAVGAWHNNLLPAIAAISILAGLGLHRALQRSVHRPSLTLGIWLLVIAQFAVLTYDPRNYLPTPADRAAGEALVQRIRKVDGEVFVPGQGYLARLAGKRSHAHSLALDNLFLDDPGAVRIALWDEMAKAMREQRFGAVILTTGKRYRVNVRLGYAPAGRLFDDPDVFWPVTGGLVRPEFIYRAASK